MNRVPANTSISIEIGKDACTRTYENGIGVVRILSRPTNDSTSWFRAPRRASSIVVRLNTKRNYGWGLLVVGTSIALTDCKAAIYEL